MNIDYPRASARIRMAMLAGGAGRLRAGLRGAGRADGRHSARRAAGECGAARACPADRLRSRGGPAHRRGSRRWLDGYMPYALTTGDIAGAVVAIVKDGEVVTELGYGFADVEKRTPVDPKVTLFRPGSVSKLFIWTAVMQQVEAGKIDLDADVNKYLDFNDARACAASRSRMRNLMTAHGGLRGARPRTSSSATRNELPTFEQLLEGQDPGAHVPARHDAGLLQLRRLARRLHRRSASPASLSTTISSSTSSSRST